MEGYAGFKPPWGHLFRLECDKGMDNMAIYPSISVYSHTLSRRVYPILLFALPTAPSLLRDRNIADIIKL